MKAFPRQITFNNGITKGEWIDDGMDLRDYFAAKAMQTILSGYIPEFHELVIEVVAKHSYLMADGMMKSREKNQ